MELQSFLEERLSTIDSGFNEELLVSANAFYEVLELTGDEQRSIVTLASFVIQAAVASLHYEAATAVQQPRWLLGFEALQVNAAGRFSLLVFSRSQWPRLPRRLAQLSGQPFSPVFERPFALYVDSIGAGYRAFLQLTGEEAKRVNDFDVWTGVASRFSRDAVFSDALGELPVIVMGRPSTVPTAAPHPAWRVSQMPSMSSSVTAGILATDRNGRRGVTTALHGFGDLPPAYGTAVYVEGQPGTLCGIDEISDSCFIEIADTLQPSGESGLRGVLSGQPPAQGELADFDGAASGPTSTTIVALDPFITLATDRSQKKLYTGADTQLGDSGAALVDRDDRVMGFAFERTGIGAPIDFSTWIWADTVVKRLGIRPLP